MKSTDSEYLFLSLSTRHIYEYLLDSADLNAFHTSISITEFIICSIQLFRPANTLSSSTCPFFPLLTHLGVYLNTSFSLCLGHHVLSDFPPEKLNYMYLHSYSPGLTCWSAISLHLPSPGHHLFSPKMLQ